MLLDLPFLLELFVVVVDFLALAVVPSLVGFVILKLIFFVGLF